MRAVRQNEENHESKEKEVDGERKKIIKGRSQEHKFWVIFLLVYYRPGPLLERFLTQDLKEGSGDW